jgi:hypothetical protein
MIENMPAESQATSGITTVARTGDILVVTVPLLSAAKDLGSILTALSDEAVLIDHFPEEKRGTDLVLTFQISTAHPDAMETRPETESTETESTEVASPSTSDEPEVSSLVITDDHLKTARALMRSRAVHLPEHRITPEEVRGQFHVEIPLGSYPNEIGDRAYAPRAQFRAYVGRLLAR